MAGLLAKLSDVKAQGGISGSAHDTELTRLLTRASALVEALAGASLLRTADITEYPLPRSGQFSEAIHLARWPVEAITSVKLANAAGASDADFTALDALDVDTDYVVYPEFGRIELIHLRFAPYQRAQQVVYTAGFADPGEALPSGASFPPADLQGAIVDQVIAWHRGGKDAGMPKVSVGDDSFTPAPREALPVLREACRRFRRFTV